MREKKIIKRRKKLKATTINVHIKKYNERESKKQKSYDGLVSMIHPQRVDFFFSPHAILF